MPNEPEETYVQWQDPNGVWHEPGEIGDYSAIVDAEVLRRVLTIGPVRDPQRLADWQQANAPAKSTKRTQTVAPVVPDNTEGSAAN